MKVENIIIKNFPDEPEGRYASAGTYNGHIKAHLYQHAPETLESIEIYYYEEAQYINFMVGRPSQNNLAIIINAMYNDMKSHDIKLIYASSLEVNKILYNHITFEDNIIVYDGVAIGEVFYSTKADQAQINLFFDLYNCRIETIQEILKVAMDKYKEMSGEMTTEMNPQEYKEFLVDSIVKISNAMMESKFKQQKIDLEKYDNSINDFKSRLSELYKKREILFKSIIPFENIQEETKKNFMKDLESILSHPKILNVSIVGNKIVIDTSDLIITDARDVEYYGGKFKISIDLQTNNVTFDSTEKHNGYWTEHDPHPHVSGRSGQACFGNVETTLIQLISDLELYAVTMMCLNFLQSANNDDPAGQNIRKWSRWVDGEIVPPDYDYEQCWNCGCDMEGEEYTVYESIYIDEDGDIEYGNEVVVCEDCRENDFSWSEEFEIYYGDVQDDRTICDYCNEPINSGDMEYIFSWVQVDIDNNDECEVSDDVDYYCHSECASRLRHARYCDEAEVYTTEIEYIGGEEE